MVLLKINVALVLVAVAFVAANTAVVNVKDMVKYDHQLEISPGEYRPSVREQNATKNARG